MKRNRLVCMSCLAGLYALVASFSGCGTAPHQATNEFKRDKVYKVGMLSTLTGPTANIGFRQVGTISDYVRKINEGGGINGRLLHILGPSVQKPLPEKYRQHQSQLSAGFTVIEKGRFLGSYSKGKYVEFSDSLVYDTNLEPPNKSKVAECVNKLIEEDVLAILGPTTSGETLQIITLVENAKIPLISFGENPAITNPPRDWVFAAKPDEAVSAITDALKSAGSDRNAIRRYLETRLPRTKR